MIGLDTNVLVRFTMQDDAKQSALATRLVESLRVFQSANADFADCLIERSAAAAGCERTMTFDRGAVKGCGMTLVC